MIHTITEVSCNSVESRNKAKEIIKKELRKDNIEVYFKDSKSITDKDGETLVFRFKAYAQGGGRKNILIKIFEPLIDKSIIWGYFFVKE